MFVADHVGAGFGFHILRFEIALFSQAVTSTTSRAPTSAPEPGKPMATLLPLRSPTLLMPPLPDTT